MSIEPTSVSKPVLREVEPSSGAGLWRSKHGSSHGGKDGPFSSIWEKTIQGAQKLMGRESTGVAEQEDEKEKSDTQRNDSSHESMPARNQSAPNSGLGNIALGRGAYSANSIEAFSGASRAPRFVETANHESESAEWVREKSGSERNDRSHSLREESRGAGDDRGRTSEVNRDRDNRNDEDETEAAKSQAARRRTLNEASSGAAPSPRSNLVQAHQLPANGMQAAATETDLSPAASPLSNSSISSPSKSTKAGAIGAVSGAAPSTSPASSAPTVQTSHQPISTPVQSPVEQSAETVPNQPTTAQPKDTRPPVVSTPTDAAKPTVAESSRGIAGQATLSTSGEQQSNLAGPRQVSPVAGQSATSEAGLTGETRTRDAVLVGSPATDESRFKDGLAEAAQRMSRAKSDAAPQQPLATPTSGPAPSPVSDAQARPLAKEPAPIALEHASEGKDSSSLDGLKKDLPTQASRPGHASRTVGAETGVTNRQPTSAQAEQHLAEGNANQAKPTLGANTHAAGSAREGRFDLPRPVAPTLANANSGAATKGGNGGVAGVGGIQVGATAGTAGTQSHAGQGDSGGAAKQDLGGSPQLGSPASKSAEKPNGDPASQSFDVRQATGESRRAQAASKAETTSYVSKSAEEVKEIVATLSKSIDRLVTNRQGSMNIRINFEHGGTLTLKVSMEGGQVNSTMQTDVAGLESLIKSNWSELANDWSQKGVKLNVPQFNAGTAQSESELNREHSNEFASRQERHAGSQGAPGQGFGNRRGGHQAASAEGGHAAAPNTAESAPASQSGDVSSERELKTYA